MNQLDQLKRITGIAADSAEYLRLAAFAPRDAVLDAASVARALQQPPYAPLARRETAAQERRSREKTLDELLVRFGSECLRVVPGRVSTEVDARLAFDAGATIARAQRLVELYQKAGADRERLLIGIAATWEGIQAAKALEHQGIRCELTLVFSLAQAVAGGEAGVSVVAPAVGPIADWQRRAAGASWDEAAMRGEDDPGVCLVARIYTYFRKFGVATEVRGSSLRNRDQVTALAGCDLLAVGPELLVALQAVEAPIERRLDPDMAKSAPIHALTLNEASFRYALNEDAMASEQLATGIRTASAQTIRLERQIEGLA